MPLDPHALHLAIRWLHVAAMATAFGGALTVFVLSARTRNGALDSALVEIALRYEFMFWLAAGVLAMTGIGNLAAFGTGLPLSRTDWGMTFMLKLGFVLGLIVLSLPRTLAIAGLRRSASGPLSDALRSRLRAMYGGTGAAFAVALGLAVWLAHG
jgi:putative copper export protein